MPEAAARGEDLPRALTAQKPGPDFYRTAHAHRVETADALPGALEDALFDIRILPD